MENKDKICVVVTILPQAEFVEKIGGDKVNVIVMVPPGASPHTYELTPRQLLLVSKAQIYFQLGSGVDFEFSFLNKILRVNTRLKVVNCSRGIKILDRDPHVWLSPRNAKIMVKNIFKALVEVDPRYKSYYLNNMHAYLKQIDRLDKEIRKILENMTDRSFLVYHPAWRYFSMDYNLTQIPVEREGKSPTAKGLIALINQAVNLNKKVIYVSPQFDWKKAEVIAESIHGKIVFIDPLAKDYINNLRLVALKIAEGISHDK
ncbi:TPA: zinc ABC transporter substrate-binding protein [Candidatus Bathyarchaeota archaeon]|nr:zinc ABC transporter substrate-binding protein [Candidatus Bathyarchaeota archaeon]